MDTESEVLIQKAIEKLVEGRTSIIIAHRLSTIKHADKIIVLDKGSEGKGNHEELLKIEMVSIKIYMTCNLKKLVYN
ncbi:MAG: hypothetical protein R2728_01485 [Chitinophagales bacterium]